MVIKILDDSKTKKGEKLFIYLLKSIPDRNKYNNIVEQIKLMKDPMAIRTWDDILEVMQLRDVAKLLLALSDKKFDEILKE